MSKAVIIAEGLATVAVIALAYYAYKNADKIGASIGNALGAVGGKVADAIGAGAHAAAAGIAAAAAPITPTNPNNVFYKGATAAYQGATGNTVDSLGTGIANVFPSAAEREVNRQLAKKNDPGTAAVLPSSSAPKYSPPDQVLNTAEPDIPDYMSLVGP